MKKLTVFFIFLSSCCFGVKNNITSIPSNFYVNNGKTNFSQIFKQSYELQKKIEELFNKDKINRYVWVETSNLIKHHTLKNINIKNLLCFK